MFQADNSLSRFPMVATATDAALLQSRPLRSAELKQLDAYWRAANYLAVGMIYLQDNPLLREVLRPEHVKNRLLGHWGSSPGQSFIWTRANRLICHYKLDCLYLSGPGHGAPGMLGPCYLDGSHSEVFPHVSQDEEILRNRADPYTHGIDAEAVSQWTWPQGS